MKIVNFPHKTLAISALMLLITAGCVHRHPARTHEGYTRPDFLSQLSLGMSKDQVKTHLSTPHIVRGSITDESGQTTEVWEYCVSRETVIVGFFTEVTTKSETYLLYFRDNKLAQWGREDDWKAPANHVQEIRHR